MPSQFPGSHGGEPGEPNNAFSALLDEVKRLIDSTPDRGTLCRNALHEVFARVAAESRALGDDTKHHPDHKTRNDQQLLKLAIELAKAMVTYGQCLHTITVRQA